MFEKTKYAHCETCTLRANPGVFGNGKLRKDKTAEIVFIGEGPGETEIKQGTAFVGPSGVLLRKIIEDTSLSYFWITNAALCQGDKASEKEKAAVCCRDRLIGELFVTKPTIIVTLGNIPTDALLGKGDKITRRRGIFYDVELSFLGHTKKFKVMPTFHPAAILRNPNLHIYFEQDIKNAISYCLTDVPPHAVTPSPEEIEYTVTRDFRAVLAEAERSPFAVLDIETTGLDMINDKLLCVVIATQWNVYIIPSDVLYTKDFSEALRQYKIKWSGHNAKFDRNFLLVHTGVPVHFWFDTMLAHYLFDENQGTHGAKQIAQRYLGAPNWEESVASWRKEESFTDYSSIPTDVLYKYAANDGFWQYQMTKLFFRMLEKEPKLKWVFENLLMPGMHTLSDAEVKGVRIDEDGLKLLAPVIQTSLVEAEQDMVDFIGHSFNPRSPVQVAKIMFDELGLPQLEGRSTSTVNVLLKLQDSNAFVDLLLRYRDLNTTYSRYVKGLWGNIREGRVHTTFNLTGTKTGRLSSSDMNLQNITKKRAEIKSLFLADEGKVFVRADQSQVELRMLAWLSDDPFLINAFRNGVDLHGTMAEAVFGLGYTKEQRNLAKAFNFGLPFGRSVHGIMRDGRVKIAEEDAIRISNAFFDRSPGVVDYMNRTKQEVIERGYVESPLGRRRRFSNPTNDPYLWDAIARQAINMKPQSSASDITLHSINTLHKNGFDVRLTVHDDIAIEVDAGQEEEAYHEMIKIMVNCGYELYGDKVPFEASGGWGKSWGEL